MEIECCTCNIMLEDACYKSHLKSDEHLKELVEKSIFISQIPGHICLKNLLLFFQQFGDILDYKFIANNAIIEFKSKGPVNYLLSNSIYFMNTKLMIYRRNVHKKPLNKKKKKKKKSTTNVAEAINDSSELVYSNLKSIIESKSNFHEQLTAFLNAVTINESEIELRYNSTIRELNKIFQIFYPRCKIYKYGSTVSGLGLRNCDLDIYLDSDISAKHKTNCKIVFAEIKRIVFSKTAIFSKVVPIPKARIPIIKFVYLPKNISCDISFKNNLGVHNSLLIKHCLSFDTNLKSAMLILKYWISNIELKIYGKMTKYALTLLFIFYLQQAPISLIPPIIEMKRKVQVPEIVDGWQVNIDTRSTGNSMKKQDMSIPELLQGFFNFYANYNFKSNVICCVDGISHNKESFSKLEKLPECMNRYKEYLETTKNPEKFPIHTAICVQDPTELNNNVTKNVTAIYLQMFKKYCAVAKKTCVTSAKNMNVDLLSTIFSNINIVRQNKSYDFKICVNKKLLTVGLPSDFESRTDIQDKKKYMFENWFDLVLSLVKQYLEDVLKLKVMQNNLQREVKQQKVEEQSDVHSKDEDVILLYCSGNHCLWKNRKGTQNVLDPSKNLLTKEIELSKILFDTQKSKNTVLHSPVDLICEITKILEPNAQINFYLSNNSSCNEIFHEISVYMKKQIPTVINATLIHMQQFKKDKC